MFFPIIFLGIPNRINNKRRNAIITILETIDDYNLSGEIEKHPGHHSDPYLDRQDDIYLHTQRRRLGSSRFVYDLLGTS